MHSGSSPPGLLLQVTWAQPLEAVEEEANSSLLLPTVFGGRKGKLGSIIPMGMWTLQLGSQVEVVAVEEQLQGCGVAAEQAVTTARQPASYLIFGCIYRAPGFWGCNSSWRGAGRLHALGCVSAGSEARRDLFVPSYGGSSITACCFS